jgi:hypothetical protein
MACRLKIVLGKKKTIKAFLYTSATAQCLLPKEVETWRVESKVLRNCTN